LSSKRLLVKESEDVEATLAKTPFYIKFRLEFLIVKIKGTRFI